MRPGRSATVRECFSWAVCVFYRISFLLSRSESERFLYKSFLYFFFTSKTSKCASCVVLGEIIPFCGRKRADFSCTPVPSEQGQGPRRYYCIIVATPCRPFYSCDKTVLSDFYWPIQILCHDYYQVLMW